VAEQGLRYADPAPFAPDISLGQALLAPTRLYVRSCLAAIRAGGVKALAHITGGGLLENIPRVLPGDLAARLDSSLWRLPPVFRWLSDTAAIAPAELARTFNCGLGMVAVVAPADADRIAAILRAEGETVTLVGRIVPRGEAAGCSVAGLGERWPD
jgi:phosphoribosylformylglycinamidine cyclo-ligase